MDDETTTGHRDRRVLAALAGTAVLLRLVPSLRVPAGPDEAGYLLVAGQAHGGGPFLYGDLWVDRPPLLLAVFRTADALGGLLALRLLGLLAVALAVVAAGVAGRAAAGRRGGRWAAVVTAGLLVSPLLGSPQVDGELLALPLVLSALAAGLPAALGTSRSPGRALALAGLLGGAAVMVKQNAADGPVLLAVVLLVSVLRGELPRRRGSALLAALVAGAVVPVALVGAWALTVGAGVGHLYTELVAFRRASLQVLASSPAPVVRAHELALLAVASGIVPLLVVGTVQGLRRWRAARPLPVALGLLAVLDILSVVLGGSFWPHYLLQLVPLCALTAAALARPVPRPDGVRGALALGAASALLLGLTASLLPAPGRCGSGAARAEQVARWLADQRRPGDTAVTLYGSANTLYRSGMSLPYPYLWSLPVRTLDPDLQRLHETLSRGSGVDYVVLRLPLHTWGLDPDGRLERLLARDYRPAAVVCGRTVLTRRSRDSRSTAAGLTSPTGSAPPPGAPVPTRR